MKRLFSGLVILIVVGCLVPRTPADLDKWNDGTSATVTLGTVNSATAKVGTLTVTNAINSVSVGTLYLSNMVANIVPIFDGNTNLVKSATTTNDLQSIKGISTLTTTWTAVSSGSNYVADLSLKSLLFNMTTNLNLLSTTNGTANFSTSVPYWSSIKVINNSGTNFPVTWPATWHTVGTRASAFVLTNGDFCDIAIEFAGPSTDQTNNWIGVAYKQY